MDHLPVNVVVHCYQGHEFSKKHDPTVVADMSSTRLVKDGAEFNLQIWDTPGNEDALESLGDRNLAADGCILVYVCVYDVCVVSERGCLSNKLHCA